MAFSSRLLYIDRGRLNNAVSPFPYAEHRYGISTDAFSTIETAGYFPDLLGRDAEEVKINDRLEVIDSTNVSKKYKITSISPLTLVLAADSYSAFSLAATFDASSNVWTAPLNTTIELAKVENKVTMHMTADITATTNGAPSSPIIEMSPSTRIPEEFRPISTVSAFYAAHVGGAVTTPGNIIIVTNGGIQLLRDATGTAWPATTGDCGAIIGSWSWLTA